ncbi:MAG: hypothetical protein M3365_09700, partial [Gemmatimonadota bacterium]|nr:hypothetical protein [Gemmatimonadota bacterium]
MMTARISLGVLLAAAMACSRAATEDLSPTEKAAIADSLKKLVVSAYDLSKPDPVAGLMSLYPDGDSLVSASGGGVVNTRGQLEQQVRT